MQGAKQEPKFVLLAEALSWIAFRTYMDAADIKERLRSNPAAAAALEKAMQQFSVAAGDGHLKARGRHFSHIDENGTPQAGDTADIREYSFKDFQQFDLDLNRLQRRPAHGRRVLGSLGISTVAYAPDGAARLTKGYTATVDESYARAFQSFAGAKSAEGANLGDGYVDVEVDKADLVKAFPPPPRPSKTRGRPPELDYDAVRARARDLRKEVRGISITSAAASMSAEFTEKLKREKPFDPRGIEKIIAPLWQSGEEK